MTENSILLLPLMTENSILLLPLIECKKSRSVPQPLLLLDELSKIPRRGVSRSVKKSSCCSSIRCVASLLLFLRRRFFHRG